MRHCILYTQCWLKYILIFTHMFTFYAHMSIFHMCVGWMCMYVCASVSRNQRSTSDVIPQLLSMLVSETESLTGTWDSPSSLVWMSSKLQQATWLSLLAARIASACHHAQLFVWVVGVKLSVSLISDFQADERPCLTKRWIKHLRINIQSFPLASTCRLTHAVPTRMLIMHTHTHTR